MSNVSVWDEVTPEVALGDRLQNGMTYSAVASGICDRHRDPTKRFKLIKGKPGNQLDFLNIGSNKEILANLDSVATCVKVAKVTHPEHPAFILSNLLREPRTSDPGFTL